MNDPKHKGSLSVKRYGIGGIVGTIAGGVLGGPLGAVAGHNIFKAGKEKKTAKRAEKAAEKADLIARMQNVGQLPATFSAQLPAPNLPALTSRQPAVMPQQDWTRYGMGPEQQFFTNTPAPQAAIAPSAPAMQLAQGGGVSHGRSDDVPALLSRGEYVIDAETMALLGNGDPTAGAEKMDQWRIAVRRHKGTKLAKGGISPDAKMPNDYMKVNRR